MLLSDTQILKAIDKKEIICEPFEPLNVQPSSLDLRLGAKLLLPIASITPFDFNLDSIGTLSNSGSSCVDYEEWDLRPKDIGLCDQDYCLNPGDFVLAQTYEYIGSASNKYSGQIADKSTLARLGLSVCFSAGWIDPGNVLNITLELKNNGNRPITLMHKMHICQIKFFQMGEPSKSLYNGKYLNSKNTEGAK
jgi:dCTP deaminase